jgi:predicted nuclease with TOPRIM domain
MLTEREQQQAEQCLEELEIKTIHEQSRNHTLQQLKQENAKLKRQIAVSKEKSAELQEVVDEMAAERHRLESKLQAAEDRVVEWARERTQLEKQIQATREQSTYLQSLQSERTVPEAVDREEVMAQCYEERDLYWRLSIWKETQRA